MTENHLDKHGVAETTGICRDGIARPIGTTVTVSSVIERNRELAGMLGLVKTQGNEAIPIHLDKIGCLLGFGFRNAGSGVVDAKISPLDAHIQSLGRGRAGGIGARDSLDALVSNSRLDKQRTGEP